MTTIYYLIKKESGKDKAKNGTDILLKIVKWTEVNEATLISAHTSDFNDFEDAVQYFSAQNVKNLYAILTRNKKDYKYSANPVMTPEEFLRDYSE